MIHWLPVTDKLQAGPGQRLFILPWYLANHLKVMDIKNMINSVYNGFYRKFNEEENFPEMAGQKIRAYFDFDIEEHEAFKDEICLVCS